MPSRKRNPPTQELVSVKVPDLFDVIGYYSDGTPETCEDRLVSFIRAGVTLQIAAAAVGTPLSTVRRYLEDGAMVLRRIHNDGLDQMCFTDTEMAFAHFARRLATAQGEAGAELVMIATGAARGGYRKTTTTVRKSPAGKVLETTVKDEIVPPDPTMLKWLLAKTYPDEFGDSPIQITGAGGGPIEVAAVDMQTAIMAGLQEYADRIVADDADNAVEVVSDTADT